MDALLTQPPPDAPSARRMALALQALLDSHALAFRPPPAEPTTCCGRGCNGCVWEGWVGAMDWWRVQALAALAVARPG